MSLMNLNARRRGQVFVLSGLESYRDDNQVSSCEPSYAMERTLYEGVRDGLRLRWANQINDNRDARNVGLAQR